MTWSLFWHPGEIFLCCIFCVREKAECEWASWSHTEYYALVTVACACVAVRDVCRANCNPFCLLLQEFEFGWFKVSVLLRFKWLLSSAFAACDIKLPESHKTCLNVTKTNSTAWSESWTIYQIFTIYSLMFCWQYESNQSSIVNIIMILAHFICLLCIIWQ